MTWIKATLIYYLPILGVRSPVWVSLGYDPDVSKLSSFLEALGKNSFPCAFRCWHKYVGPISLLSVSGKLPLPSRGLSQISAHCPYL